jgi:hypothetical protein
MDNITKMNYGLGLAVAGMLAVLATFQGVAVSRSAVGLACIE